MFLLIPQLSLQSYYFRTNFMSNTLKKYEVQHRDQIRSIVGNYLDGSPRGKLSRNTYKKALAVMEVH